MSYPVSFRDFGSSNEELYRKYVSAWSFRECIAHGRAGACYDRFGRAAGRAGADSLGGVGGATIGWLHERRRGAGEGGFGRERGTLEWRPIGSGGDLSRGADGAARASGLGVDGGGSGSSEAPVVQLGDGGSRGVPGSGGDSDVSSSDHTGGAGGDAGGTRASGAVTGPTRGKNYEKNKARRERAKASRSAGNVSGRDKTLVSVRAAHPQLDETWAERKIVENQVATAQLRAKLAKMEKEQQDGTAEKRYKVEANLVQGQLDGAFALVPQQRVVSWAKTIVSGSSGSSKTGASGKKTVASISSAGSRDASSASSVTVAEKRLTEENAKLRKQLSTARADCEKKIEKIEEVERMKRLEMGNGIERRLMELEEEVQRRDKKLKNYELYTGLRL